MYLRLFPLLLSLWLLASLQGAGLHMHVHPHDAHAAHGHVATALDLDHARAHADGAVDHDDAKSGGRAAQHGPAAAPAPAPSQLALDSAEPQAAYPRTKPMHSTGPPRHVRPPSQAPPLSTSTA